MKNYCSNLWHDMNQVRQKNYMQTLLTYIYVSLRQAPRAMQHIETRWERMTFGHNTDDAQVFYKLNIQNV